MNKNQIKALLFTFSIIIAIGYWLFGDQLTRAILTNFKSEKIVVKKEATNNNVRSKKKTKKK